MRKTVNLLMVLLVLMVTNVMADDFNPPAWRGGPLSVEVEWDFETTPQGAGGLDPDSFNAVGGSNGETLWGYYTHIDYAGEYVSDPDGQGPKGGGYAFSGFVIHLDNWIDNELYKDIRVQLTGYMSNGGEAKSLIDPYNLGLDMSASPMNDWGVTGSYYAYDASTDITYASFDFRIWPNPDNEDIWFNTVPQGVVIDQVYVDTISIPEPASLCLLGLGGLMFRKWKLG